MLTIILAVNIDGSEKLITLIIRKDSKPRDFKVIGSILITYLSNK
ncbi:tigger transposable element-derived protein 4-like, partial [Aphis craccivora]